MGDMAEFIIPLALCLLIYWLVEWDTERVFAKLADYCEQCGGKLPADCHRALILPESDHS